MEGVENHMNVQFKIENRDDGTFVKEIRDSTNCKRDRSWTEAGTWTFDGKEYAELTTMVDGNATDPNDQQFRDTFEYSPIDSNHFTMVDVKTGISWSVSRVPAEYQMPAPSHCMMAMR